MKTLVIIAALLAAAHATDFNYCEFADDMHTLWPVWDNFTLFNQCSGILQYKTQVCPEGLLFDYCAQV
jgi:hypothetical protein